MSAAPVDAHLIETRLRTEGLLKGRFLDVRRDTVALPGGGEATREYVVHPGAVMVVPILDDGRLVVERQYRSPLQQVVLEFPAGKKDPGESGRVCAERELAEETGYRAAEWGHAGVLHNAPAYSTEHIEIWFARGLTAGAAKPDVGEHLEVLAMTEDEIDRRAGAGELTDAKTLIGLLWLQKWRAGRWPVRWSS
ncbi:NUDIX domain-containing protein [Aquabacterium sp. J223]|uniref:NUDIX domain-containing protein n=1 Tax=Aquabacterium sp. J223 TaxID=2898431 RepID=UPI0021ADCBBF|nr:NUDIX hydrolase [Aquabacterium sp. J223]UUX94165.1 NUDIX hydrolase [Aquabacterium sp. J223]